MNKTIIRISLKISLTRLKFYVVYTLCLVLNSIDFVAIPTQLYIYICLYRDLTKTLIYTLEIDLLIESTLFVIIIII